MIPAFGFSTGDIIAIAHLVHNIYACVASTAHLQRELVTLSEHYAELCSSIQRIVDLCQQHTDCIAPATQNCLEHHLGRCREHLEQFLAAIQPLTCSGTGVAAPAAMKMMMRRVAFAPRRVATTQRLVEAFGREEQAIRLCTEVVSVQELLTISRVSQETQISCDATKNNFAALVAMLGSMPKELGYTWEGGELKQHVTLLQASGEVQNVPIDYCVDHETFHRYLLLQGSYPGRRYVEAGHYQLVACSNGKPIDLRSEKAWKAAICPGQQVMLSVMLGTCMYAKSLSKQCPRCISYNLEDGKFSGWRDCKDCGLSFNQLPIVHWTDRKQPVDMPWDWGPREEKPQEYAGQAERGGVDTATRPAIRSNNGIKAVVNETRSPPAADRFRDDEDRLRRLTVVFSPIFNFVFRSRICGCRLSGDSSPFTPASNILWNSPCRLHFFDSAADYGIHLTKPDEGYDPEEDPYFNRYGGHLAFALFICDHPVVQRSIDVEKLLPLEKLEESGRALEQAWLNPDCRGALEKWRGEFTEYYFKWKTEYGEENEKWKRRIDQKRNKKVKQRRGSF